MTCDGARERILALPDGADPGEEAARHVRDCADCARFLADTTRLRSLLEARSLDAAVERLLPVCRADLAAALAREPWWRGLPSRLAPAVRVLLVPALGAALAAGGFLVGRAGRGGPSAPSEVQATTTVRDIGTTGEIDGVPRVRLAYDTVRQASLEGSSRDPAIRSLLVGTLRDSPNDGLRLEAIDALQGAAASADVRDALLKTVGEDANPGARLKAIDLLEGAANDDRRVRRAFLQALQSDRNPGVRVRAVDALGAARDPEALPVLRRLAGEDANDYVRLRARALLADYSAAGGGR